MAASARAARSRRAVEERPVEGGSVEEGSVEGAPSVRWLVLASVWLVFVLLPNGVTTWLGFAFIGFAVLRPLWIAAAVAYFVATVSFSTDAWGAWGVVLGGALWVVGIGHGLAANRRWLSTLWGRRERGERLFGRGGRPRRGERRAVQRRSRRAPEQETRRSESRSRRRSREVPAEAEALLGAAGTARSDYLADGAPPTPLPASTAAPTAGARAQPTRAQPTREQAAREQPARAPQGGALPEAPVDVNTATPKQFQTLPGITRQRAKDLVRERTRLGGFRSIEQFVSVAALQPHEVVRLTPVLECSPRPRAPRTFGRRVDL